MTLVHPTKLPLLRHSLLEPSVLLLFVAIAIGGYFRLHSLGSQNLHFDEALGVLISDGPISEVLENNRRLNSSPPAISLLLHFSLKFGRSEFAVRAIPAIAGVAIIPLFYVLGLMLSGSRWIALLASFIIAVAPTHTSLSRQFRVYEVGALLATLVLIAALYAVAHRSVVSWLFLAASSFVAINMQYGLAIFVAAVLATVFVAVLSQRALASSLAAWGCVALSTFGALVLVYFSSLRHHLYPGRGSTYIPYVRDQLMPMSVAKDMVRNSLSLVQYSFPGQLFLILIILGVITAFFGHHRARIILGVTISACAITCILSLLGYYPYLPVRQCLFLTVPFLALSVCGLDYIRHSIRDGYRATTAICAFALLAPSTSYNYNILNSISPPRISTTLENSSQLLGDSPLFVLPSSYPQFMYYRSHFSGSWITSPESNQWLLDERAWGHLTQKPAYADQIDQLLKQQRAVFVFSANRFPNEPSLGELSKKRGWSCSRLPSTEYTYVIALDQSRSSAVD